VAPGVRERERGRGRLRGFSRAGAGLSARLVAPGWASLVCFSLLFFYFFFLFSVSCFVCLTCLKTICLVLNFVNFEFMPRGFSKPESTV
jgi:hypothetical protein